MVNKTKTCRCCLSESKVIAELYEFSSEVSVDSETTANPQNFVKISDCFRNLTLIDVPEELEDLSKICSACLGDLKFCYMFQMKCLESQKVYNDYIGDQFELVKEDDVVKSENTEEPGTSIIEYVEEEFVDEDTNDGFEDENGIIHPDDDDEEMEDKEEVSIETRELAASSSDAGPAQFRRHPHKKRQHKKNATIKSEFRRNAAAVSTEEYESHEVEHDGELCYKCKKCDARFLSKADARDHLQKSHSNDEKPFLCATCSKSFKNRYQLILHNRSHTGEKPFECHICNRCFSMSSNLQKHLDTHSTEKTFECSTCHQFFKTQRSLKFHTVCYHQPEAKVKCPTCDKSFVNKSYLKMHQLYHTGEKNFTCTICNSKYYKSSHLKRHIQNVHMKLRLMKCEYCSSDFVRKETYKAHIISHHKRHISEQEFEEVLEKIKRFQPPSLDINQFTVEKQLNANMQQVIVTEVDGDNMGELEMIEEDELPGDEGMEEHEEYYESEIYEDEQ